MKRVIFSEHALFQMKERGIDRAIVITTIAYSDKEHIQLSGRIQVIRRMLKNGKPYCAVVVYENLQRHFRVITVFITSKIHKYLRP